MKIFNEVNKIGYVKPVYYENEHIIINAFFVILLIIKLVFFNLDFHSNLDSDKQALQNSD